MTRQPRLPSWATIGAWVGIAATLMGIVSFVLLDLPSILGGGGDDLTEQEIIGTLAALQDERNQAQLQLTQIALANAQAANQATQQWLDQRLAEYQATLAAAQAEQDAVLATQNAVAAGSATAAAEIAAADATGTQAALDAGATAAAVAQVTPTPTDLPTSTPEPEQVSDHRLITSANVGPNQQGQLEFSADTGANIPDLEGLAYVWYIDSDFDSTTGLTVQDIGAELALIMRSGTSDDGRPVWVGRIRPILADGTLGDPVFTFAEIKIMGARITGELDANAAGLTGAFDWVVRAELGNEQYAIFPTP